MKKFIVKIGIFFLLVAIIDVVCGFGFDFLRSHAKGGSTAKQYYISEKCEDDILILGSSKADRHYVPSVIMDSLGVTCYNCGEPGCGIIPAYARYKMVAERHKPKLVIYEVTPNYDYFVADDYSKYLGRVRQDTDKESVKELYSVFGDDLEKVRQLSNMYRNNSAILHNAMDIFASSDKYFGYEPLFGVLKSESKSSNMKKNEHVLDTLKYSYVEKLFAQIIEDDVPLVCMISPQPYPNDEELASFEPAIRLCQKYDIPFIDNRKMDIFAGNKSCFQDFTHLNHTGAIAYTQQIIPTIKHYIKN